ncbi:hypothetical protein [Campylobacter sp.]|uniref:hypothetical protein n=1 Tax=Campylobacter sp. TaxID=205 RepID=UPI00259C9D04|nr:hypothetical protein [Campylobacter sp.]MBQ3167326.1 hypothetical protein [Campylobacter sp.]
MIKRFALVLVALLILLVGIQGYAYLYSNFIINSAITILKDNREFKIDNINKSSSIFSTDLNATIIYKDLNLNVDLSSYHNALAIFSGIKIIGDIKDLEQNSTVLAKFDLDIPINSDTIHLNAKISPIKFMENHSFLELSSIDIEAIMDSSKLYFIKANINKANLEFDDINGGISGVVFEANYINGIEFNNLRQHIFSSNETTLIIEHLKAKVNPIDISSNEIKINFKSKVDALANITADIVSKYIMINGIDFNDISSKIRLENIDINSYKNLFKIILDSNTQDLMYDFMTNEPKLYIDSLSVKDIFDFKFSIFGNNQTLKAEKLNLNGELKAYKPLSTLKGLEFLSIYEKFLISNGILIQNNEGYISKFKSDIQNNEIIFNNSVKFSDIVSNILINK